MRRDVSNADRPLTDAMTTMTDTLKIENLHVSVEGKPILSGVNLDDPPRRNARADGPQRLGQEHAGPASSWATRSTR